MTWRQRLSPRIAQVLYETDTLTLREKRRALRIAWDHTGLGRRCCYPYTVWCDEARRQLGHKKPGIGKKRWRNCMGQPALPLGAGEGELERLTGT